MNPETVRKPRSLVNSWVVERWLRARSVARGLPQPVRERGGLRLDTRAPHERRRHLFAAPVAGLHELAQEIGEPLVFLKLCGSAEELAAALPQRWLIQPPSYMMRAGSSSGQRNALPLGYSSELKVDGAVASVSITAEDGALAASGHAAEYEGVFIYDRIVTEADHRRRGLASYVMSELGSGCSGSTEMQILVATQDGRALYSRLGWNLYSDYSTAVIPAKPES